MIDKYLNPFTKFPESITPASLLIGLCWLVGKCWALGYQSFGYISIADIIRTSFSIAPVIGLFLICFFWLIFFDTPKNQINPGDIKKAKIYGFLFIIIIAILVIFFIILEKTPKEIYNILFLVSAFLFSSFVYFLSIQIQKNKISEENAIILLYGFLGLFIFSQSYTINTIDIFYSKNTYDEKICLKNECWNGRTIERLSDATYFKQEENGTLIAVMNTEIVSIKYLN